MPRFPLPPLARAFLGFGLAFFAAATLYLGAAVLVPLVEAVFVWFVLNAMASGLRRLPVIGPRLPRAAALLLSALAVLAERRAQRHEGGRDPHGERRRQDRSGGVLPRDLTRLRPTAGRSRPGTVKEAFAMQVFLRQTGTADAAS
jgi:hypothetical protein